MKAFSDKDLFSLGAVHNFFKKEMFIKTEKLTSKFNSDTWLNFTICHLLGFE